MYNHLLYFSYWIFNSFAISVVHYVDPNGYELGTWKFSSLEGAIYAGFWMTFVVWIFWDLALAKKIDIKNTKIRAFLWFFVSNIAGVWITAHMSEYTGFGITNFGKAIILGFIATILQKLVKKIIFKTV